MLPDRSLARCRACGARIGWVRTAANGKLMPLDPDPHPAGNVELYTLDTGQLVARVHGQPELLHPDGPRYMPHQATCPNWE